jgi:hypothetical protein
MSSHLEFSRGRVRMWVDENGVVMLKAVEEPYPDPVELIAEEARDIAEALLRLADEADA